MLDVPYARVGHLPHNVPPNNHLSIQGLSANRVDGDVRQLEILNELAKIFNTNPDDQTNKLAAMFNEVGTSGGPATEDTEMIDEIDYHPGMEDHELLDCANEDGNEPDFDESQQGQYDPEDRYLDRDFDYRVSNDDSAAHQLNPTLPSQ